MSRSMPELEDFYRPSQIPASGFWADFMRAYAWRAYGSPSGLLDVEYFTPRDATVVGN